MKLITVIENIDFFDGILFVKEEFSKSKEVLYVRKDGIHFWGGFTVENFSCLEEKSTGENRLYNFQNRYLNGDDNKKSKLIYVIHSLLIAADKWLELNNRSGMYNNFDLVKQYSNCILSMKKKSLDYSQISHMKNLMSVVENNTFWEDYKFCVKERDYYKYSNTYKDYEIKSRLIFGNVLYNEELEQINITTYRDCVEITHDLLGVSKEYKFSDRENIKTLESKIIKALDYWKTNYTHLT